MLTGQALFDSQGGVVQDGLDVMAHNYANHGDSGGPVFYGATANGFIQGSATLGGSSYTLFVDSRYAKTQLGAGILTGRVKSSTTITLSASKVEKAVAAKVRAVVKVPEQASPAGTAMVSYGKSSKTVALKSSAKGKITVTLPKLKAGKYQIRAAFDPQVGWVGTSTSPTRTLTVAR